MVSGSTTREFLYDGDQLVAEYNGSSGALLRRYVDGPGEDQPLLWYEGADVTSDTRRSVQTNYQGSIDSVADGSGKLIAINTYDEYGKPGSGNIGTFQYTGQVWLAELGIYYYKARTYDPRLGRFLQTDPVGYKDDLDLYAYVHDDRIDGTDATGECDLESCYDLADALPADTSPQNRRQPLPLGAVDLEQPLDFRLHAGACADDDAGGDDRVPAGGKHADEHVRAALLLARVRPALAEYADVERDELCGALRQPAVPGEAGRLGPLRKRNL